MLSIKTIATHHKLSSLARITTGNLSQHKHRSRCSGVVRWRRAIRRWQRLGRDAAAQVIQPLSKLAPQVHHRARAGFRAFFASFGDSRDLVVFVDRSGQGTGRHEEPS